MRQDNSACFAGYLLRTNARWRGGLTSWAQAHNLVGGQNIQHKMKDFKTAGPGACHTALLTHSAQAAMTTESTIREGKYTGEE